MLGDPRKNCLGLQMHAQWYLSGGRRQMHRASAPLACWVILATGQQTAFMTGAEFLGPARHQVRASVTLTHPCQHAEVHLPCTRQPDVPCARRPVRARPGVSDRRYLQAFVITRAGTDTMPRREGEDEIEEDAAPETARGDGRASRFGTRARDTMTPPSPERPPTPDDLRTALRVKASFGVKLHIGYLSRSEGHW
jgi:hypothetical protein